MLVGELTKTENFHDRLSAFASDHGYRYGEHGPNGERRLAYEEAIRIPLLIRCSKMIQVGTRSIGTVQISSFAYHLVNVRTRSALSHDNFR